MVNSKVKKATKAKAVSKMMTKKINKKKLEMK